MDTVRISSEILSAGANAPPQQERTPGLAWHIDSKVLKWQGLDHTGYLTMENPTQEFHGLTRYLTPAVFLSTLP